MSEPLSVEFTAPLVKSQAKGGWTYVKWSRSAAFFATHGRVKVRGTIEGEPFETSFMALGDGTHKLPVAGSIRSRIGKGEGDEVHVVLTERIG